MMRHHRVAIAGMGLSALTTAARLTELGVKDIALYADGSGGTPFIAAINFVLPDNPYGDTPERYEEDMLQAGYDLGDRALVHEMASRTLDGYQLLRRWGVNFAVNDDGSTKLRHVSGHSCPRSLCRTDILIGREILREMIPRLEKAGVEFHRGCEVVELLAENGRVNGFTVRENGQLTPVYAQVTVAAWGGAGHLLGESTYPMDILGNTLGMAKRAGASMVDMEFLEFEPLVILSPPGAAGEASPTAMLGEGGILTNALGERFLLRSRPQGEAGASKSLINREAWKEIRAGKGTPHGGFYLDLRPIDRKVLESYPWFLNRLLRNGIDPGRDPLEVGPLAHSFSGGILVDTDYASTVKGLYAVGEACGGIHGACRSAGNAGSQAALSGMLCAEGIQRSADWTYRVPETPVSYREDSEVRANLLAEAKSIGAEALSIYRNGDTLQKASNRLEELLSDPALERDSYTAQCVCAISMMVRAALERRESRGTHSRTDYPETDPAFERKIVI